MYRRLQEVGIFAWEDSCWFSFFSRLWGWRAVIFKLSVPYGRGLQHSPMYLYSGLPKILEAGRVLGRSLVTIQPNGTLPPRVCMSVGTCISNCLCMCLLYYVCICIYRPRILCWLSPPAMLTKPPAAKLCNPSWCGSLRPFRRRWTKAAESVSPSQLGERRRWQKRCLHGSWLSQSNYWAAVEEFTLNCPYSGAS